MLRKSFIKLSLKEATPCRDCDNRAVIVMLQPKGKHLHFCAGCALAVALGLLKDVTEIETDSATAAKNLLQWQSMLKAAANKKAFKSSKGRLNSRKRDKALPGT